MDRNRENDLNSDESSSSSDDINSESSFNQGNKGSESWDNEPSRKDSGGLQGDRGSGGDIESDVGSSSGSSGREMEH